MSPLCREFEVGPHILLIDMWQGGPIPVAEWSQNLVQDSWGCSGNFLTMGCRFEVVADYDSNILLLVCGLQHVASHGVAVLLIVSAQVKYSTWHLSTLNLISHLSAQLHSRSNAAWSNFLSSSLEMILPTFVSSANFDRTLRRLENWIRVLQKIEK